MKPIDVFVFVSFFVSVPNPDNCVVRLRIADPSTANSQDLGLVITGDLEAISKSSSKSFVSFIFNLSYFVMCMQIVNITFK